MLGKDGAGEIIAHLSQRLGMSCVTLPPSCEGMSGIRARSFVFVSSVCGLELLEERELVVRSRKKVRIFLDSHPANWKI